jgi:lactoylglutathione lyase
VRHERRSWRKYKLSRNARSRGAADRHQRRDPTCRNVADTTHRIGTLAGVKTLHTAYRVSDLPASLSFYSALGYVEIGRIDIGSSRSKTSLPSSLRCRSGVDPGPVERPGGPDGPQTAWLTDPDGYRIELVQWPPGWSPQRGHRRRLRLVDGAEFEGRPHLVRRCATRSGSRVSQCSGA